MKFSNEDLLYISSHFQDDISRTIYSNRLLYAITGDNGYLRNICMTIPEGKDFWEKVIEHSGQEMIIFGAGQWGRWIKETFDNIVWSCFADNNVKERNINGIAVISADELIENHNEAYVIIASKFHWKEIESFLLKKGFCQDQLYPLGEVITGVESKIYFDLPELPHLEYEVFVDGGGYDGMSSFDFCKWTTGDKKVIIFEPETASREKCMKNLKNMEKVEIVAKGLWSEKAVLSFNVNGSESKVVNDENSVMKIPVISLDEYLSGDPVTFIKMDIEGAELNAIKGASETIVRYKPKLAISIYHRPEDIIEIPKILLELNPEYRFWIRHYSFSWFDTILYAV